MPAHTEVAGPRPLQALGTLTDGLFLSLHPAPLSGRAKTMSLASRAKPRAGSEARCPTLPPFPVPAWGQSSPQHPWYL